MRFLVFLLALTAFGQTVKGSLTVEGKALPLQFACAFEDPDPFDDKKTRISVVLAPAAPAGTVKSCRDARWALGEGPALIADIETPDMTWSHGSLRAKGSSYSYSFSGTEVPTRFEPSSPGELFGGRLSTTKVITMSGWPPMEVDVTFAVALERLAPKTAEISGAAAMKHPATLAAKRFLTAMTQANEKDLRNCIVEAERAKFDERMKSPEKAKMFEMMKIMAVETLKMTEATVVMRGEIAEVTLIQRSENSSEKSTFRLRQEQGAWRVTEDR